ncbi:MAG: glycosyltransferase [Thermodesulfobacteriota bacterium]|nr:glycosyltransferase [Thermodesulfobacteriota bacterium]
MRVSVFITSYNQKKYLVEAIQSVLNQTLRPFEIIVVDDCSTDGSQDVIAGYASRHSRLIFPIYHTHNRGVTKTRIDALRAVTGDYVTYVDGDDRYLPTKIEKEAGLLQQNPKAQIAFSNNYYMTSDGTHRGTWADEEKPAQGDIFQETFGRNFPGYSLFRMEMVQYHAWKRVGFHDSNLRLYEDFDMRIRLTKHYSAVYWDEPLSEIRFHYTGLSGSDLLQQLDALEYVYTKNRPLLSDLSAPARKNVEQRLLNYMAQKARRGADQALGNGQYRHEHRMRALKYYIRCLKYQPRSFDYKLMLRIFLSRRSYNCLRTAYQELMTKEYSDLT